MKSVMSVTRWIVMRNRKKKLRSISETKIIRIIYQHLQNGGRERNSKNGIKCAQHRFRAKNIQIKQTSFYYIFKNHQGRFAPTLSFRPIESKTGFSTGNFPRQIARANSPIIIASLSKIWIRPIEQSHIILCNANRLSSHTYQTIETTMVY